jgi:glycine cleavage system regulatory protein
MAHPNCAGSGCWTIESKLNVLADAGVVVVLNATVMVSASARIAAAIWLVRAWVM